TYARKGQVVMLHAVVRANGTYYSDAPSPRLGRKALRVQPLARAPAMSLSWARIEPATASLSNTASGTFRFERIDYRTTAIVSGENRGSIPADVRPTLTPDHGGGVGTMRYQLTVVQGERTLTTPGPDARRDRKSTR